MSRGGMKLRKTEGLTEKQKRVLLHAEFGADIRETAWRMAIAFKTVQYHRLRINKLLETRNINQAIRIARERGYLPPPLKTGDITRG